MLLDFDPLVAIGNALATLSLYQGLLWSLTILIPTLFLGQQVIDDLARRGTLVRSPSYRGVAEEAPGAYKDVSAVAI